MGVTNPTNYKYFERATPHATLTFAGAVPPKLFLEFIEISNFSTLKTSVSYTHLPSPRDVEEYRNPSCA